MLKYSLITLVLVVVIAAIGCLALIYPSNLAEVVAINLMVGLVAFAAPIGIAAGGGLRWFTAGFTCTSSLLFASMFVQEFRLVLFTDKLVRGIWQTRQLAFGMPASPQMPWESYTTAQCVVALLFGCVTGLMTQMVYEETHKRRPIHAPPDAPPRSWS